VKKLLAIAGVLLLMDVVSRIPAHGNVAAGGMVTLVLGFFLLVAYLFGKLFGDVGLPGISGYMIAGVLVGPYLLGYVRAGMIDQLRFIDDLALTFIAIEAGAELRLRDLRAQRRSLTWLVVLQLFMVFAGVSALIFWVAPFISMFQGAPRFKTLVISLMIGTLAVARSPSSAVAIIDETRARGPYTEITLGVTVIKDFIVIVFFGVMVSIAELLSGPGRGLDLSFIVGLMVELLVSMAAGYLVGKGLVSFIKKTTTDLPLVLLGVSFLIKKLADYLSLWLKAEFAIGFHLEPLIIAVVAGFVVQNFSDRGEDFLEGLESTSLPVFVLFFAVIGSSLDLSALRTTWALAIFVVVARAVMVMLSGYAAGRLSGDTPLFSKMYGLAFITQAGVSLGLTQEVVRRFPEWGETFATMVIASITINQLVGPITFKYALEKVGETRRARLAAAEELGAN